MDEVRKLREQAGLTQDLLARVSAVDRSMISKYETGDRSRRLDTLQRLATAVELEVVVSYRPMTDLPEFIR
jgi:transcriptional regulator with XRE-family HTH domain